MDENDIAWEIANSIGGTDRTSTFVDASIEHDDSDAPGFRLAYPDGTAYRVSVIQVS